MRALVSRSLRPRLSSNGVNLSSSSVTTRQAVSSPTRRKCTFNDAFTILLAPVFALAFIGDATLKDRKKKAWEQKIADVKAEIEAIRERELHTWSSVQSYSIQSGVAQQRRQYATTARAISEAHPSQPEEPADAQIVDRPQENAVEDDETSAEQNYYSTTAIANWQQYESLVASKLVLEMLLHIRTGKSWVYKQPTNIVLDPKLFPESLDDLVAQLRHVNNHLQQAQRLKQPGEPPESVLAAPGRRILHNKIVDLAKSCRKREITAADLVYEFARAITQTRATPYSSTYRLMAEAFMSDHEDLAYLTTGAMIKCKQRLGDADVELMIAQCGRFKDGGKLTNLLWMLTKKEDRGSLRLRTEWSVTDLDGKRIPAPRLRRPRLLATMIRAALQCGMERFAEAYTNLLFASRNHTEIGHAIRYVLTYFVEMGDWKSGVRWLRASISHMSVIASEMAPEMPKSLTRILELCLACDKQDMYEEIMKAIIAAGIDIDPIDTNVQVLFSTRVRAIRKDWATRMDHTIEHRKARPSEQAKVFQEILAEADPSLSPFVGLTQLDQVIQATRSIQATSKIDPFESPAQLLHGIDTSDIAPKSRSQDGQYQTRITELEAQLAESRKQNEILVQKLAERQHIEQQPPAGPIIGIAARENMQAINRIEMLHNRPSTRRPETSPEKKLSPPPTPCAHDDKHQHLRQQVSSDEAAGAPLIVQPRSADMVSIFNRRHNVNGTQFSARDSSLSIADRDTVAFM